MRTLTRSNKPIGEGGEELDITFKAFKKLGVGIRKGELNLIGGLPGSGKSTLALKIAVESQHPTMYFCADTSEWTMRVRLAAMLTGLTQLEAEQNLLTDPDWSRATLQQAEHVAWSFDTSPDMRALEGEMEAYEAIHAHYPALVVVDNLMDINAEIAGQNEWAGMRKTMSELKDLARKTGTAVLVLHHISEGVPFVACPPRSAIQGKVNQLPAVIITIDYQPLDAEMHIGVVKNRFGKADVQGNYYTTVTFDGARMQIIAPGENKPVEELDVAF